MNGNYKSEFGIALKNIGVDVEIVVPLPIHLGVKKGFSIGVKERYDGITTFHPWYLKIPFGTSYLAGLQRLLFRISIKKHLRKFKNSGGKLIHSNSISLAGSSANFYKKLGLVSVVTLHDHEIHDIKYRSNNYLRFLEKEINKADQLLCVSGKQLSEANARINIGVPNEIIPYGIKTQVVTKQLPNIFTISTVCRLVKNKGVDLLIKAVAEINQQRKEPIRLIVVGSGDYEMNLKKLVFNLDQELNIKFCGERPNHQIHGIVANTHLFVLPSFEEALGLVYFEAMSVKTPIVGVIGQGISDFIKHGINGYLVPPEEIGAIVELIETLIEDRNGLEEVGKNGFKVFEDSNLEWSKNAKKHYQIYQRLLSV